MNAAQGYAKLSKALRLKVGAVLVKEDRIISVGYNGTPFGYDNFCEYSDTCNGELKTKPEVVHAEMNCIAFAAKNGIASDGATLVVTHSPCFECSKLLLQAGIKEVYYKTQYRDDLGLKLLEECNIKVKEIL